MKRVLYFFPLNPAEKNSGSNSRALGLLHYFKERGWHVDFVSKQKWGNWTAATEKKFIDAKLADNLYIFRRKPVKKNPVVYFFGYKLWHILFEKKLSIVKGSIPNHTTLNLQKQFNALFKKNKYDYVIISYAYWADLIKDNPYLNNATTIIDTHDILATQHQHDTGLIKDNAIKDELRRVGLFDQIWAISPEERDFFKQYFNDKVKYIPVAVEAPMSRTGTTKEFDIIYVATDNPHNLLASKWFFDNVYPLLEKQIKICVIGTILPHIPQGLSNITYISFIDDLNAMYARSKAAICPMLSGTGVKVKVVEALANGLPVVCNERGQDGLPYKSNNGCLVTNDAEMFAGYIKQLLSDEALYQQQSDLGGKMFRENFSKQSVYKKMDEAFGICEL